MSVFGSIGDLDVTGQAGRDYFAGFQEKLKEGREKQAGIVEAAGTIADPTVDEMFDSHHAAYQVMAKELRDSLPNAMSSDEDMAKWEAKLQQANAFAEKAKAYFTSEKAQLDKNSKNAQGLNPSEYERRGVRDGRTYEDYQASFLAMNDTGRYSVTVDENGQFVIDGGGDIFKIFDEHNFMPSFEQLDVRNPESWWAGHAVAGLENEEEVANNIEGRIVKNPTEAANAQRWWAAQNDMDVEDMDEEDRRIAIRKYAEAAATKWTPNQDETTSADEEQQDSFTFNPDDVQQVDAHGAAGRAYNLPPSLTLDFGDGSFEGAQFVWFEGMDPMIYASDGTAINVRPQDLEALEEQMDSQLGDGAFNRIYEALAPPLPGQ